MSNTTHKDMFWDLDRNDIEDWAGNQILARGKRYWSEGRVHDLGISNERDLIADLNQALES